MTKTAALGVFLFTVILFATLGFLGWEMWRTDAAIDELVEKSHALMETNAQQQRLRDELLQQMKAGVQQPGESADSHGASSFVPYASPPQLNLPYVDDAMWVPSRILGARLTALGISLNLCGLVIGASLAGIGVCLFILGAHGDVSVQGEGSGVKILLKNLSPGLAAIICGTGIAGTALIMRPSFTDGKVSTQTSYSTAAVPPPAGSY